MRQHAGFNNCVEEFLYRLYRKAAGREAKLCYMGHATMERYNARSRCVSNRKSSATSNVKADVTRPTASARTDNQTENASQRK